jgi:hypothetical protein
MKLVPHASNGMYVNQTRMCQQNMKQHVKLERLLVGYMGCMKMEYTPSISKNMHLFL